ncbi:class II D-tagatose-bisphosphate aldolase, non-catalytic subunit [Xanthomonas graminis]|nr:class II D-tagatose-bisphosphate aldolase, non-catalytic subunit [Xanthomonas translucens]UKE64412.1 class II D-tagatose-bisphosphate aldolase, non-catalytic subunit [Xanthomonas translucens pv. phlei]
MQASPPLCAVPAPSIAATPIPKDRHDRWTRCSGAVVCMVTAGAAQAQSCRLQTHTLPLPLVSQHMPEHAYQVRVQVGTPPASANSAAAIQVLEVDTGSTGVVVPLSAAIQHAWDASSKLGYIFYSSNSQYHPGKYVQVPMRLGVSADGKSAVASIDSIEVLAAQCSCGVAPIPKATLPGSVQTLSQAPDNCAAYNDTLALSSGGKQMLKKCTTIPSSFGMMGVGYDRGVDAARNPFLNLVQMQAGSISPGYIIRASGITLGVSEQALQGFSLIALQRAAASAAGGADWQAPNACASFPASGSDYQVCGKLLPDTGITYMMLTPTKQPPAPAKLQQTLTTPAKPASTVSGQTSDTSATTSLVVPEGTPMTLAIGATGHPVFSYGFKVGGATPATPDGVQWRTALNVPPAHINSGRHVLAATDYAYDGACGHAGFRPAPATP